MHIHINFRSIFIIYISFLCVSCKCTDEGSEGFALNDFEKTVIPFESQSSKEFINSDSQIVNASITAKVVDIIDLRASDDESCFVSLAEYQETTYKFDTIDLIYTVRIVKRKFNQTEFFVFSERPEFYTIQNLITENIEEGLTDVTIDGIEFTEVFLLSTNNNMETAFESIIYSVQNGIEFIKFRNGNSLRLLP